MFEVQALEVPTGTNILDLNFYCLDSIFSLECLSIKDLCSLGETNSRLKEVVNEVFAMRHKNYKVNLWETNAYEDTRRVLSNFGAFISHISISGVDLMNRKANPECLDWLVEYCHGTLESLELCGLNISKAQTIKFNQVFGQLKQISLRWCRVHSDNTPFSSLVELKLVNVEFEGQHLLTNTFPKLDRFEYEYYIDCQEETDFINDSMWSNFFSRHKYLSAVRLCRNEGTSHLLPMTANNCKQLQELAITFEDHPDEVKFEKALSSILSLHHLNKLNMGFNDQNITKFTQRLEDLKSLEVLRLSFFSGDSELVPALSKLTKLQVLELYHCEGFRNLNPLADLERLTELTVVSDETFDIDLVSMIARLMSLKTLSLVGYEWVLDKRMYLGIVDVLRRRPDRFHHVLRISCETTEDFVADLQFDKLVRITPPNLYMRI